MLKKLFLLLIITNFIIIPFTCFAGLQDYPKVAVLEFENRTPVRDETLNDGKFLSDLVINELLNTGRFNLMEFDFDYRNAYARIHQLDIQDLNSLQSNLKIAKSLGIEYLVVGTVTGFMSVSPDAYMSLYDMQNNKRRPNILKTTLTLQLYETESGRIALAAQGFGKAEEKMIDGKYSALQVHETLSNAINDAVNGKLGVIAKLESKKNSPKKIN